MQAINRNPSPAELRKFGLAMILGFGVIGAVLWYFGPEPNTIHWVGTGKQKLAVVLGALGAALLVISLGPNAFARPVYVGWMSVGLYLGAVVTFVLLSVLFLVLLPFFSLIRFKDPLRLKLQPAGESYWEEHQHHESTLERTIRPF